jgi:collagen type III alpha
MSFDKDGNGKVTRDELPERMQRLLERADGNGDGAIDETEARKLAERFRRGPGRMPPRRRGPGPGAGDDRPPPAEQ